MSLSLLAAGRDSVPNAMQRRYWRGRSETTSTDQCCVLKEVRAQGHIRVRAKSFSRVWPCVTPWTVACSAPLTTGYSRQEYWSGLPFPSPGDLPDPGIEPRSPAMEADALTSEPPRMKQKNKKVTRSMIQSKSNKNAKFGERIT